MKGKHGGFTDARGRFTTTATFFCLEPDRVDAILASMSRFAEKTIAERQRDAAAARKAAVERHRTAVSNPGHAERLESRQRVVADRKERMAERNAARQEAAAREAAAKEAEEAARRVALAAEAEAQRLAREAEADAAAARAVALEAEKQAARDARYAARKERKRAGR